MKTMIVLVTPEITNPVTTEVKGVEVLRDFGRELVMTDSGSVGGYCMLVRGEVGALHDWLRPYEGFWTSTNPLCGDWKVMHVPEIKDAR